MRVELVLNTYDNSAQLGCAFLLTLSSRVTAVLSDLFECFEFFDSAYLKCSCPVTVAPQLSVCVIPSVYRYIHVYDRLCALPTFLMRRYNQGCHYETQIWPC